MTANHTVGILYALLGGICLSTSGVLMRNLEHADGWDVLFYRSIAFLIAIGLYIWYRYRRDTFRAVCAIGQPGLLAATLLGVCSVCYVFAILNTTVANVVFIIGSGPLVTALVAWVFIGERIRKSSLAAMLVAAVGIALMVADGMTEGGMVGILLALAMVSMFAFYLLILRSNRHIDQVPATGLSGFITIAIAAIMVDRFEINLHDFVICVSLGVFQFGLGFLFLTLASRHIPAAEVALFALSESVLAPIWVWIGVNEIPSRYTLYGSVLVFASVIGYCLISIRAEKRSD
ncbi:MAG: DMT family transporter [Gammaproteobacteria bacterium]|nr:DMT family transporter [Gammaproteobacteria bacterium]MYD75555.1 DMT family transporter [Gammaproteobacteria bacterium]MYJ53038.1 DMT family transporter [Gammaproteobacteria bacterium]